jgi:hypothetical protein
MTSRRRFVSLLALLAVAWTALWPLVTSLEAKIAGEEMPLCHQAGMQVAPGEMPQQPEAPGQKGKVHCPLCVMAFYGAFDAPVAEPEFHLVGRAIALDASFATHAHRVAIHLPESRAPPVSLKG